ncbi:hypothetical protein [Thalassospira sp.]|uniref:hypothetical protein n=1 Tax=Thalassospira sp. TaxID=1912094 RepID=UPI0025D88F4E|nr:hypothetical protein [Thalassospira sp.]|tara:strand:- start:949 stop:1119 length:171 start_codon:yes stop_codon:yes gene_type:complete
MMIIFHIIAMTIGGALFGGVAMLADPAMWLVVALTIIGAIVGYVMVWVAMVMGWIR